MEKPHITIPAFFIFSMMPLFLTVAMLQAQTTPGEGKNTEISTSAQKQTIHFENPDFNFGKVHKGKKVEHS
jgi:hypothetical protein